MTPRPPQLSFQLAYGDCDTVGIAYFAIYYPWMERLYSTWLYSHGLRVGELAQQLGVVQVGVSSGATYHRPAKVFDELTCRLVLGRLGESSYSIDFEFTRDGELITLGTTTYACRNLEWNKTPIPPALRAALDTLPARQGDVDGHAVRPRSHLTGPAVR